MVVDEILLKNKTRLSENLLTVLQKINANCIQFKMSLQTLEISQIYMLE